MIHGGSDKNTPRSPAARAAPWICSALAAVATSAIAPPAWLAAYIGSDIGARAALGVLVFFVLYAIAGALGLTHGRVGLPGGLSFERASEEQSESWLALGERLQSLEHADQKL